MVKVCKVTIITERNTYVRRIVGKLSTVMNFINETLDGSRQLIGIPYDENIIEVKYKEYNEYND